MSWMLPRLVGVTRASDLLLSGRAVTGAETADWGLWNDVLARRRRRRSPPPASYAATLATDRRPERAADDEAPALRRPADATTSAPSLTEARRLLDEAMTTAEYREGVAALRERRPPRF